MTAAALAPGQGGVDDPGRYEGRHDEPLRVLALQEGLRLRPSGENAAFQGAPLGLLSCAADAGVCPQGIDLDAGLGDGASPTAYPGGEPAWRAGRQISATEEICPWIEGVWGCEAPDRACNGPSLYCLISLAPWDDALAFGVLWCESGGRADAEDGVGSVGGFQIHLPSHKGKVERVVGRRLSDEEARSALMDLWTNINVAWVVYVESGGYSFAAWAPSAACWT